MISGEWLKSYIYINETHKWETKFPWLARQRLYKDGQRQDETSGYRKVEGRLPNATLFTLTFYWIFSY